MTDKDLKKANELTEEIKKLQNFVWVIAPEKTNTSGVGKKKLDILIQTKRTIKLWGNRNFGAGIHTEIIEAPNEIITDIAQMTIRKIKKLQRELSSL